jgi:iron complex outermembrane receptor protein
MKKICMMLISIVSVCVSAQIKKDTTTIKRVKLNEVIVMGSLDKNPVHSSIKNQYQKKVIQPKNVADLFSEINGFSIVKRGNYAIDPTFRASLYEQLNVMYNGATKAVHACPNRMDPITTHVIPEEVSKIEVIKGPYTVRYGATFGGIVNMVTEDYQNLERGFHGKFSGGYETNGSSYVSMLQLQEVTDKFDIIGNIGYRNFNDYTDGDDNEIPSAFKSTDYGVKVGYNVTDNQRLQAHWRQSFGRDIKHAALPMDTEFDNSSILSLDYKIQDIGSIVKSIKAKGYYSYVDHLMTNENRPNFPMMFASSPVNSTTIGGKLELNLQLDKSLNFFAGTDAMHISREGNRTRAIKMMNGTMLPMPMVFVDKIWQDAYLNDFGAFAESIYSFGKQTFLTTGVRLDFVDADAKDLEADFASRYPITKTNEVNVSGTVSLKHKFSKKAILELAFGRGVRTANMAERFINHFTVGQDSYEYLGNPLLKPEINNQFEIGVKGSFDVSNNLSFVYETSIYHSIFENYISAVVDPTIPRKFMPMAMPQFTKVFTNIKDASKTGFEIAGKLNIMEDYFVRGEMAYVRTRNKDFNESLPLNPPLTSKISAGLEKDRYWANMQYNIVSKQTNIAPSFGETITPSYQTIDIKGGFKFLDNLTFGAACLNVLNKTYINHLNFSYRNQADLPMSPITEPGRNFTVFLQYKF